MWTIIKTINRLTSCCLPERTPLAPIWSLRAPVQTTPPSITCRKPEITFVLFVFILFSKKSLIYIYWFLYHVRACFVVEHLLLYCSSASTAQHNTAQHTQHSAISPHKAAKYEPIRVRQRKQADTVGESQHMSSIHAARRLLKTNERNRKN